MPRMTVIVPAAGYNTLIYDEVPEDTASWLDPVEGCEEANPSLDITQPLFSRGP